MALRAVALVVLAVGLAAPAHADSTDDAFIANLSTSGMDYGAPERAIQIAKTVVCGTLNGNPNTSNPDLIAKVLSGQRPLQIFGSGRQTRTLTHVDDIADGIVTAMSSPKGRNEDFNISASRELTVAEIARSERRCTIDACMPN